MPSIKIWCLCGRAALVPEHLWGAAKKCPACLRIVHAPRPDPDGRITQITCPACQQTISLSPDTNERVVLCPQGHIVRIPVVDNSPAAIDEAAADDDSKFAALEVPRASDVRVPAPPPMEARPPDESCALIVIPADGPFVVVSPEHFADREVHCIDCGARFTLHGDPPDGGPDRRVRCERCESAFHVVLAASNAQLPALGKSTTLDVKPDREGKCIDCGVSLTDDAQPQEPGSVRRVRCARCESAFHIVLAESTGQLPVIGSSSMLKPRSTEANAGRRETCVNCGAQFTPREPGQVKQTQCEKCERAVQVVVATSDAQLAVAGEFDSRDRIYSIDELLDREPPTIAPLRPRADGTSPTRPRPKKQREADTNSDSELVLPVPKRRSSNREPICGAGFWHRFLCYSVDAVPIFAVVALYSYFQLGFDQTLHQFLTRNPGDLQARLDFLVERNRIRDFAFTIYLIYSALCDCSAMQGTFGKRLCGVIVVDADGHPISLLRSIVRNAAKVLSALPFFLGFLWIAFSPDKRAWHDMIAGTYVVEG